MQFRSLNSAIKSVTNPQPKNEALTSLQENRDLLNAVLPYTVGLQSVIVLVMIEALLDGSGPISGTVSLFKNLMKKWKDRVLGGKLSADEAQSFIAEYEKLSASLPTGKRNFLKASFNKMEQAAKAGDKGKLGAIATEVKDYLARNSAEVKEEQEYIAMLETALEAIAEELECSVEDLITESTSGYFTNAKSRKAHVTKFYARKAKEKASRSPAQVEKDKKTATYVADYEKKTGRRIGRID